MGVAGSRAGCESCRSVLQPWAWWLQLWGCWKEGEFKKCPLLMCASSLAVKGKKKLRITCPPIKQPPVNTT